MRGTRKFGAVCEFERKSTARVVPTFAHDLADGVPATRDAQRQLLRESSTHHHRSVDTKFCHRELVLADTALAFLHRFRGTSMQGHVITFLRPLMHMVLHAIEDILGIQKVLLTKHLSVFCQLPEQVGSLGGHRQGSRGNSCRVRPWQDTMGSYTWRHAPYRQSSWPSPLRCGL